MKCRNCGLGIHHYNTRYYHDTGMYRCDGKGINNAYVNLPQDKIALPITKEDRFKKLMNLYEVHKGKNL